MHVIFYQCSSQLCPLAFHFNITNINIVAPYTDSISWAATKTYYSMIYAVFGEISCNIMSSSCQLSCSMSMLRHCASKNNVVGFLLWLEVTCDSSVCAGKPRAVWPIHSSAISGEGHSRLTGWLILCMVVIIMALSAGEMRRGRAAGHRQQALLHQLMGHVLAHQQPQEANDRLSLVCTKSAKSASGTLGAHFVLSK